MISFDNATSTLDKSGYCKGCWKYNSCDNRDSSEITVCFIKYKSICYYCQNRKQCRNYYENLSEFSLDRTSCDRMIVCSNFKKEGK